MKKLIPQLLIALAAFGAYLSADRLNAPTHVLPVTYKVKPKLSYPVEVLEQASVLIIGDRHARRIDNYSDRLKQKIVPKGIRNLKIINIAEKGEGIHRTYRKIRQLKTLPKIVVYMGGSEEYYEKRFRLKDRKRIYNNFGVFKNTLKVSAILILPYLSKFLYTPTKFYMLPDEPVMDEKIYSGIQSQVRNELAFKFFQLEFGEMVKHINEKGSSLIVVTTPLKRDIEPNQICDNTVTEEIELFQNKLQNKLELGKHVETLPLLKDLAQKTIANSRSYYLLGKALIASGKLKEANVAFTKSHSFDCNPKNGHIAFNQIIRGTHHAKETFILMDFDHDLNNFFGRESVFYTDNYPQDVYYNELIDQIGKHSKNILNL